MKTLIILLLCFAGSITYAYEQTESSNASSYKGEDFIISFNRAYLLPGKNDDYEYCIDFNLEILNNNKIVNFPLLKSTVNDNFGNELGQDSFNIPDSSKGLRPVEKRVITTKYDQEPLDQTEYLIIKITESIGGKPFCFFKITDYQAVNQYIKKDPILEDIDIEELRKEYGDSPELRELERRKLELSKSSEKLSLDEMASRKKSTITDEQINNLLSLTEKSQGRDIDFRPMSLRVRFQENPFRHVLYWCANLFFTLLPLLTIRYIYKNQKLSKTLKIPSILSILPVPVLFVIGIYPYFVASEMSLLEITGAILIISLQLFLSIWFLFGIVYLPCKAILFLRKNYPKNGLVLMSIWIACAVFLLFSLFLYIAAYDEGYIATQFIIMTCSVAAILGTIIYSIKNKEKHENKQEKESN